MNTTAVDPITLEVVNNGLASVADEMALVVMRSAYSAVVRDTMDYSTALCDRRGEVVAQGLTLAVQLGTFPTLMQYVLEEFDGRTEPGDIFIANDPYGCGGQHLPDIYIIKPIFFEGALEGYAATMAHHSDVGGITPGSVAVHATEIYQEGLRMPLLKLYEAGRPNETLLRVIEKNTRQPVHVLGDIRAQVAACRTGERGLVEILERYGADEAHRYMDELQAQAERLMRAEIEALPDGEYHFEDFIDGYGDPAQPLRINVSMTVSGSDIEIDLTGTAEQVPAGLNCPVGLVRAACYCAVRGVTGRDIPNAEGYMRPIKVIAPAGTIVNPVLPGACGARGVVGYRLYDALMGVLAQVVPEKVIAPGEGGPSLFSIGGYVDRKPFVLTEVMVGCWGARATRDGLEGVSNPLANLSNQPVELIEADLPLEVLSYGLVEDSGGPGRYRGGLAFNREVKLLADEAVLTIRSDRRHHRPYGLEEGLEGGGSLNVIRGADGERTLPPMPMEAVPLVKGDVFSHVSAGGGGFGSPLERDPRAVLEDVLDEKVSAAAAREHYGVAVTAAGELDDQATAALRGAAQRDGRADAA
ncbi:MAG: N-methylhydantoinase [Thermoleophilaceae bacterium]|jgi:N-methylhydantoinase B|nr:N-methylhydantoinase [Thermoleophilaceae bacterium]MEA2406618.1 N-methylhydantoinase [Thermoleophilaceae bacterium]